MGVKILFWILAALFVAFTVSHFYIGWDWESTQPPRAAAYIVEEPQMKTFVVGEQQAEAWFDKTGSERHNTNVRRYKQENKDSLEEFEIKSRFKRSVRSSERGISFGYLKEVDNPGFDKID